ncbi:hypothetical protein HMPREF0178_01718, partial [Bilophila sp. 4_1_30]
NASGGQRATALWTPVPGGNNSPGPPQRLRILHRLAPARDTAVLWASDILFRMPQRSRRETVFQRKAYRNALPSARPAYKSLGRERDGGEGEGGGKPFSRRVPSPFPRISKCYLHHGALPLSQRELSACASRKVSMHCQKPVWRYMESWPSAARRSSGSFSRSQDSSSER